MNVGRNRATAALTYTCRGWPIIPVVPKAKIPLIAHGLKDATTDPERIRDWWRRWPSANIGLATGEKSGFFVLDVDGVEGKKSLAALEREHGPLPTTLQSRTGSGGRHLFFRHPGEPLHNSAGRLGKGLDVRGDGGYVIAPPSVHDSGKRYVWLVKKPLAEAPAWLLDLIKPKPVRQGTSRRQNDNNTIPQVYAQKALAQELVAVSRAPEGSRNDQLNRSAFALGQLVGAGALDRSLVEQQLRARALGIGLQEKEVSWTILSGLEAGMSQPRDGLVQLNLAKCHAAQRNKKDVQARESYHTTDLGNARRLVARHGLDLHYCYRWAKWLVWKGARWVVDDTAEVERRAKQTVAAIYAEAAAAGGEAVRKALAKHAMKSEAQARIWAMISLGKSEPSIPVVPLQLDANPWLLTCANGTVDLRSGELRPHRREDLCTKSIPIAYDPNAECVRWLEFLAEITHQNAPLIEFLHRAVGYALTGDTREQVLFFLYGTGANGKTTFLETLRLSLGDYAQQADFTTFLVRKTDAIRNDLARLAGTRFVSAVEAQEGRKLSEVVVKQLTGGDTVAARFLYAEYFEFRPQFKLFLAANHKPIIQGTDYAIWRRICLVPFTVTIPADEQDKMLPEKLRAELPGILAWAVKGCLAWQRHGLVAPHDVLAATDSYRDEMDVLGGFLRDCCFEAPPARVLAKDLYATYKRWCEENGEYPLNQRSLGVRLSERGFERCRGSQGARGWRGVGLVTEVTEGDLSGRKVSYGRPPDEVSPREESLRSPRSPGTQIPLVQAATEYGDAESPGEGTWEDQA